MDNKEIICIVCPIGCRLTVSKDDAQTHGYLIEGNKCARGITYGIKEMTNPTRIIPTTVVIKNAFLSRLPVKSDQPFPKAMIFEFMKVANSVEVEAPVKIGDVIIKNVLGTGINIVATRSMESI